jgi:hypothetical protein
VGLGRGGVCEWGVMGIVRGRGVSGNLVNGNCHY